MPTIDIERSLNSVRISDLLSAVEGQRADIAPERALSALLHKRMADKPTLLQGILKASDNELLRLVALRGLGMLPEIASKELLTKDLKALPLVEARVAISSLGKIGGVPELDALSRFRANAHILLHKRIDAARRLIAFRQGLDTMPLMKPETSQLRQPASNQGRRMKIGHVDAAVLKSFERRIREEVPGLKLSLERAVDAVCLKQRIWLMHNLKTVSSTGIKNLLLKPQLPMVIMGYADCTDRPYLFAHVMSQPSDDGIDIFVVRLNGEVSHYGKGTLDNDQVKFNLSAVKTRLAPAVRIAGRFSGTDGALELDEAATLEDTSEQASLARKPKMVDSQVSDSLEATD